MKKSDFVALCGELLIDVDIALENEDVKKALFDLDDEKVKELLREEF